MMLNVLEKSSTFEEFLMALSVEGADETKKQDMFLACASESIFAIKNLLNSRSSNIKNPYVGWISNATPNVNSYIGTTLALDDSVSTISRAV